MANTKTLINPTLNDERIVVTRGITVEHTAAISPDALRFVAKLQREFGSRRRELLALRSIRQKEIDAGKFPDFLAETKHIREADWTVAPIPDDLRDRRVEITGPVDRKMVINALNSGANLYMADFEDSNSPTWENCVDGQLNLLDAVAGSITFTNDKGKHYSLGERTATLLVRPRGWHLEEKHVIIDGEPISGSLFDFGVFFFNNAHALLDQGSGPYFYLPKLESHLEARLWNDVFVFAQNELGLPNGTIRATVLIETILAAFEMDEILYELRDHSAGLNCGRWDYIFSFIKRFRNHAGFVLPDRATVTMTAPFLNAYVELLIKTCHRRGIHAMGGMAAQIPIKNDETANRAAIQKVTDDKLREVTAGHDGTWVAHPGLVPLAREIFDKHMPMANQIARTRDDVRVSAAHLLAVPQGAITEAGLRQNINVGILYLEAWLRGNGCVPLYHLMEDAATAEISRAQVWQWLRHQARLDDGRTVTPELVHKIIHDELDAMCRSVGEQLYHGCKYELAGKLFERMLTDESFPEFMPQVAYDYLD